MRRAVFGLFLLLVGCGKVGAPLPPFIRIPEPINDLAVRQSGNSLFLTWTNPAKNIDGSMATDLAAVQVRSADSIVAAVSVNAAGQTQSYEIPLGPLENQRTFTAQVETARGKVSGISNAASIIPVEAPGPLTGLRGVADQRKITLQWQEPEERRQFANAYLVNRVEPPDEPIVVSETRYEDDRYEAGKTYIYQVTAVRRVRDSVVPGVGPASITVVANDKTAPQVPSGLDVVQSDTGAFLTWAANSEADLAGYRVFRSERADAGFTALTERPNTTNGYFDSGYRPGWYYAVSAVDEFGNESARSTPFRAP